VETFNTESERGRMLEKFRPDRGDWSVLNPSLDRSDDTYAIPKRRSRFCQPLDENEMAVPYRLHHLTEMSQNY
jgi:hypothetical protein